MPRQYGFFHIGFLIALGLMGWGTLIGLTVSSASAFDKPNMNWEHTLVLVLLGTARILSFPIYRRVRVALDSAFYVATAFAFGVLDSAWLLLLTLSIDALVNLARVTGPPDDRSPPWHYSVGYFLYQGGLPCLVLLACHALFQQLVGPIQVDSPAMDDVRLAWTLSLFSLMFLGGHYALAGGGSWFHSAAATAAWRRLFLPVVGAELTLVPLALAMAMGYKHRGIPLFLLIGFSGLVFGGIFRSWAAASDQERQRMIELSVINQLSRAMAKSMDQEHMFRNMARATIQLVGQSSFFTIGLVDSAKAQVEYEVFDGDAQQVERLVAPVEDGISGWVLQRNEALMLGDVQNHYHRYARNDRYSDANFNSWLGVPVVSSGDVVGIISVQSQERAAYSNDQMRVLNIIADQVAVALEASRLYELSTIDSLTGLFVRRYFDKRLDQEFSRSARYETPLSVGILDLDHFKATNDTYGHAFGDKVLRKAARAMRANMRSFDLAARYGGEEFVFILPRTEHQEARLVADRIRTDIGRLALVDEAGNPVRVSVSVGIATFPTIAVTDPAALLKAADDALYRAKAEGRDRVVGHSA